MFDVGFAEVFLLALIGLIVLGPEKLPGIARTAGGMIRKARSSWYSLRRSIEAELAEADISESVQKATRELKKTGQEIDQTIRQAGDFVSKAKLPADAKDSKDTTRESTDG